MEAMIKTFMLGVALKTVAMTLILLYQCWDLFSFLMIFCHLQIFKVHNAKFLQNQVSLEAGSIVKEISISYHKNFTGANT